MRLVFAAARGEFEKAFKEKYGIVAKAATGAIKDGAAQAKTRGRAAIGSGGFGRRWQNALRVEVYPRSGQSVNAAMYIHHNIPYSSVFQTGATLRGRRLLWLPVPGAPLKIGPRRMTPANYQSLVGPLHFVENPGRRPLLAAYIRGARVPRRATLSALKAGSALARLGVTESRGKHGTAGVVSVPLFFGVSSVRIPKKFDLRPTFEQVSRGLGDAYFKHYRALAA